MYCLNCQAKVDREYDPVMVALGASLCAIIVGTSMGFDGIMVKIGLILLGIAVGALFIYRFQYRCPRCHKHNFDRLRLE